MGACRGEKVFAFFAVLSFLFHLIYLNALKWDPLLDSNIKTEAYSLRLRVQEKKGSLAIDTIHEIVIATMKKQKKTMENEA